MTNSMQREIKLLLYMEVSFIICKRTKLRILISIPFKKKNSYNKQVNSLNQDALRRKMRRNDNYTFMTSIKINVIKENDK